MSQDAPLIRFVAQGKPIQAREGERLLDVLRREGFEVPSLCHYPGLSSACACRICLVEIQLADERQVTTACNYRVVAGLEVFLDTEQVERLRRLVIELMLIRAPHAEPILALARRYGVARPRFLPRAKADGCILCSLCVRVCRERARAEALVMERRGERKDIAREPFGEFPESCIGCGACAFVCPTGAISMEEKAVLRLRERWGQERPCRYALMGLAIGSVCERDYQCARCEVDQRMFDAAGGRHPIFLAPGLGEEETP